MQPPARDPLHVHVTPESGGGGVGADGLLAAWKRTSAPVAAAVILLLVAYWWLAMVALGTPSDWAFDFRQFWQGAHDVVGGVSPYPTADLLASAGDHLDPEGIREVFRFPYPAGAAVLLAPLGVLGFQTAAAVWSALLIGSLLLSLWLLDVRDWRVLGVVVTSVPVISSVRLGTFTPALVLLLAIAWRWRDRRWVAGGSLAVAISLKLFVWPLAIWLVATRRYAAAALSACLAFALTFGAWAVIGFDGLTRYPELLRTLSDVVAERGLSLVALGSELNLPDLVVRGVPWLVGATLLGSAIVVARRVAGDGDAISFCLAVIAAIALTPIVWLHYFALLVLPLAVRRPRFSWPWLLLWVFWLMPDQENQGDVWRVLLASGVAACVIVSLSAPSWRRSARVGAQ